MHSELFFVSVASGRWQYASDKA